MLKWQYPANDLHKFNTIPIKISATIFAEIDSFILKVICKFKKPTTARIILKKKNKFRRLTLPDFKNAYKTLVIKMVWYWLA